MRKKPRRFYDDFAGPALVFAIAFIISQSPAVSSTDEVGPHGIEYIQSSLNPTLIAGDSPSLAESVGRDEHKLVIHYRKRYLDDAALDYYLSGADWPTVKSVGRAAAFNYLDYTSRREFTVTIDPMCREERVAFAAETEEQGQEYASWARNQLKYHHLSYEEEILLLLLAEIKYDQEYSRFIDAMWAFYSELAIYGSGGGVIPRPPRLNYGSNLNRLELITAAYPGSPAALYALYFLGSIYTDLGDSASAEYSLGKALDFEGPNPYYDEIALRMANIALEQERYEKAEDYYEMVAADSDFLTDALYGFAYVNYVLAGVEGDRKRDERVLGYFGELYSVSGSELITEYCANLAIASLLSLGGYTEMPSGDNANRLIEKYAKHISDPDAAAYLASKMSADIEDDINGVGKKAPGE
jgi:hypothetical protein